MVETPDFKGCRKVLSKELFERLLAELGDWITRDTLTLSTVQAELNDHILSPALKLHQAIRCSSTQYKFRKADFIRGTPEKSVSWTVKNIKTWTEISSNDTEWAPFHQQFPGLYRIDDDETQTLELVPPVVVVFTVEDLQNPAISYLSTDSEVHPGIHRRLPDLPSTPAESSLSDSARSLRKSGKKRGKSHRQPEIVPYTTESNPEDPLLQSKPRKGFVVADPWQNQSSGTKSMPDDQNSPHHLSSYPPSIPKSGPSMPGWERYTEEPGELLKEGYQQSVQGQDPDSRVRGELTHGNVQAPKSSHVQPRRQSTAERSSQSIKKTVQGKSGVIEFLQSLI
jgi:hypothetical protein